MNAFTIRTYQFYVIETRTVIRLDRIMASHEDGTIVTLGDAIEVITV